MEHFSAAVHHVLPPGDQTVTFQGVFTNDRTVADATTGAQDGQECTLVFTVHVDRSRLDGDIAGLGFRGAHNGDIFTLEVPPHMEYRSGMWDLVFPIRQTSTVRVAKAEGEPAGEDATETLEERHFYAGSFYVETVSGSFYWLKYRGESDFRFDYTSLPTLASLTPAG